MTKSDLPSLEKQILLAHITGHSRSWVLAHPELTLTPAQQAALEEASRQLQAGVPLPYILGHWEFFGLDFEVSPDVLIPRPETELLIETALAWTQTHPPLGPVYRFIDVGTGSGIIPVTLATHLPSAEFLATDISPAALKIARRNAAKHGVAERIHFLQADLLPDETALAMAEQTTADLLTANLPYIPTATLETLEIFGREPTLALDGGPDGLQLIRRLLAQVTAKRLAVRLILLEIEYRQGMAVITLARQHFPAARIEIKRDLAGHDRLLVVDCETGP
ncbi:MAG: peptide chain release factor N(5)-glutamine methyltransferase [Anaerolineales bacterium]|nr:peptide chain release factor N(5)-glutamine methyltransferase [Anaerolineales bacterium]MDW8277519.1 peptide chain release factor N(5)-glutamine methyltransferase [Anaerolineales bacterium]